MAAANNSRTVSTAAERIAVPCRRSTREDEEVEAYRDVSSSSPYDIIISCYCWKVRLFVTIFSSSFLLS